MLTLIVVIQMPIIFERHKSCAHYNEIKVKKLLCHWRHTKISIESQEIIKSEVCALRYLSRIQISFCWVFAGRESQIHFGMCTVEYVRRSKTLFIAEEVCITFQMHALTLEGYLWRSDALCWCISALMRVTLSTLFAFWDNILLLISF